MEWRDFIVHSLIYLHFIFVIIAKSFKIILSLFEIHSLLLQHERIGLDDIYNTKLKSLIILT